MVSTYLQTGKFAGNFSSIEFVPEGCLIASKNYPSNLIDGYWNNELEYWYENAPQEEIANRILKKETELYIKRMQDAQVIWASLSAEFRVAKQLGQMDDATENIILAELKPVLDIVVPFGQWKTGYQLLIGIGSSIIGEQLYNKLHDIIWNYIQDNYEEMEITQLKQDLKNK